MNEEKYTPWDPAEFLTDDEIIIEYLKASLEDNDPEFFARAVNDVARAKGITAIAQETQLGRQGSYKTLSGERDPSFGTVMKVLAVLGIQLTIAQKQV